MNLKSICTLILILFVLGLAFNSPSELSKIELDVHELEKEKNRVVKQLKEAKYELGKLKIENKYDKPFYKKLFRPSQEDLEKEIEKLVKLELEISEKLSLAKKMLAKENPESGTSIKTLTVFIIFISASIVVLFFFFVIEKIKSGSSYSENDQMNNFPDDSKYYTYGKSKPHSEEMRKETEQRKKNFKRKQKNTQKSHDKNIENNAEKKRKKTLPGNFSHDRINDFNSWRENPNTDTLIFWSKEITKYLIKQSGIKFEGPRPSGIINFFNETNYDMPKPLVDKLKWIQVIRNQRAHDKIKPEEIPKNFQDEAEKAWTELVKYFSK